MNTSIQRISLFQAPSRYLSLFICAAVVVYILSAVKFLVRDPLGADTGAQGYIEIGLLGLAAVMVAVAALIRRSRPFVTPALAGFVLVAGLMTVSSAWSYFPALSLIKGVMFFVVLAMVPLLCAMERPLNIVRYFYWSSLGVIFLGLCLKLATHQPLFEVDDYSGRVRLVLFAWHPGTLADIAALTLLAGFLLTKRPPWFCQLFLLAINVATCARASTALLLLIAGLLFACKYLKTVHGLVVSFFAVAVAAMVLFVAVNAQWPVMDKVTAGLQSFYGDKLGEDLGTLNGRTDVWKTSSDMMAHSLVLGYGLEGVRDKILREESWAGNAHNAYLEVFLAGGLPALLILIVTWGVSSARALRDRSGMRLPIMGLYTYMFLFGFTEPNLTYLQCLEPFLIVCIDYALRTRTIGPSEQAPLPGLKVEDYQLAFAPEKN